jgi:hypothetical protein
MRKYGKTRLQKSPRKASINNSAGDVEGSGGREGKKLEDRLSHDTIPLRPAC